jgi:hypothetical protein
MESRPLHYTLVTPVNGVAHNEGAPPPPKFFFSGYRVFARNEFEGEGGIKKEGTLE